MHAIDDFIRYLVYSGATVSSASQKQPSPAKQDAAAVERTKYVGLKYREVQLPAGLKEGYESAIIGESENYTLQVMTSGKLRMLWLERIISRIGDPSGKRNFEVEVKDVVLLPTMTRRQILTLDKCYVGKKPYPPEQYNRGGGSAFPAPNNGILPPFEGLAG